jgi:hypothetical protein
MDFEHFLWEHAQAEVFTQSVSTNLGPNTPQHIKGKHRKALVESHQRQLKALSIRHQREVEELQSDFRSWDPHAGGSLHPRGERFYPCFTELSTPMEKYLKDRGYDIQAMQERDRGAIKQAFDASKKPTHGGSRTGAGTGGNESFGTFDRKTFEKAMSSVESPQDRALSKIIASISSGTNDVNDTAKRVGDNRNGHVSLQDRSNISLDELLKAYEVAMRNLQMGHHTEWTEMKSRHLKELMKLSEACIDRTWTWPQMDGLLFDEEKRFLGNIRLFGESEDLIPQM